MAAAAGAERLLDAGLRVLALHPNKVAAARDRFRVAGGKSDRFDAFVLCELARTDHHRFRVLDPDSDATKAIRALSRAREDLVAARTGIVNQLRAELERFWPGPLRLFSHMDVDILLAFLERYPSPGRRRRRRGPSGSRNRIREMEDRRLPPSLQQATARRVLPARGLKPPLAPLGTDSLRAGTPARTRPPARDPDRRPRLVPRRV